MTNKEKEKEKMPLQKCIDCKATMIINGMDRKVDTIYRSMCPRCGYYEDYIREADTEQMWCTDSGYLSVIKNVRYCTRCCTEFDTLNAATQKVHVKIHGESILAERHELCRTCFDVIKFWLRPDSARYGKSTGCKAQLDI
jgi:hypothetical protein